MEVKKYNPFVVIKPKPKPKPKPKSKVRPKAKIKLEAKSLSLENKKKLDFFKLRVLLRLVGNNDKDYSCNYNYALNIIKTMSMI